MICFYSRVIYFCYPPYSTVYFPSNLNHSLLILVECLLGAAYSLFFYTMPSFLRRCQHFRCLKWVDQAWRFWLGRAS